MSQWNCPFCKDNINQLEEAENIVDGLLSLPEWTVYGAYDTPRCLWCGGYKNYQSLRDIPAGHKQNCKRQKALAWREQHEELHQ